MDRSPARPAAEAGLVTLPQWWRQRCRERGGRPAVRHKERGIWQGLAWDRCWSEARAVGMAIAGAGLEPGDVVSLLSDNRPEWLIADLAAQAMGCVSHGIYPCSTASQVGHALREAGSGLVVVENADQLVKVLAVRGDCPRLRRIVVIETRGLRRFADPQVSSYEDWRAGGAAAAERDPGCFDARIDAGTGDQVAFLASTAGSTAMARLVAVRQERFVADLVAPRPWLDLRPDDRVLSIMPLAHHVERLLTCRALLIHGCRVHFAENQATVLNDLVEVAPHFVFAAPRFFERLHGTTELSMRDATPVARRAYAASLAASPPRWWHRLTRRRLRSGLGLQNVRVALTSGASIPAHVSAWFDALGVSMFDGYALAEVGLCSVVAIDAAEGHAPRQVDAGDETTLAPDGEIVIGSARSCVGYWVAGEIRRAATDAQGGLRTGDLGRTDGTGRVRPLGRVGARLPGPSGEVVNPEVAEDVLRLSAYIADAVVVRARDERLTALVVLEEEQIRHFAQQRQLHFTDLKSLLDLPEVDALVAAEVARVNARLPESHRVGSIRIIPDALRPGDEELTPVMRLKRGVVVHRYAELLEVD